MPQNFGGIMENTIFAPRYNFQISLAEMMRANNRKLIFCLLQTESAHNATAGRVNNTPPDLAFCLWFAASSYSQFFPKFFLAFFKAPGFCPAP